MNAVQKRRPALSFDVDCDADAELQPLASCVVPAMHPNNIARPGTPIFVDKNQLVALMSLHRSLPPAAPARVRHLSAMVREERDAVLRRARLRTWLARIGLLAAAAFVMFVATRPLVSTLLHQSCLAQGWCAAPHR